MDQKKFGKVTLLEKVIYGSGDIGLNLIKRLKYALITIIRVFLGFLLKKINFSEHFLTFTNF